MRGMDAKTGRELSGLDHLKQSIRDILTTPIGSRVMLREYGSRLFELIDSPINQKTITDIYSAVIESLQKWEPRIDVIRIIVEAAEIGKLILGLNVKYRDEPGAAFFIGGLEITV
jgi:phage baseplate assembly protein W